MIDAYYWPTPNGWKLSIALEEMELDYRVIPVNIGRGDQFEKEFLAISPNNRMPAMVDDEPADGGEAPAGGFVGVRVSGTVVSVTRVRKGDKNLTRRQVAKSGGVYLPSKAAVARTLLGEEWAEPGWAIDAKVAALAVLGALNWTVKWYQPGGARTAAVIGAEFADLLVRGLLA